MAFEAMEHYGLKVPLIPCSIHCYKQHLLRSDVVMEFGEVHDIPDDLYELYKTNRRDAISNLLEIV